jgi:hypothetical protein
LKASRGAGSIHKRDWSLCILVPDDSEGKGVTFDCKRSIKISIWLGTRKLNIARLRTLGYPRLNEAYHFADQTSEMLNRNSLVIDFNKVDMKSIDFKLIKQELNLLTIFELRGTVNA